MSYNSATGYYEYTVDTLTLTDGSYDATVYAGDTIGYIYGPVTVSFNIDNHAPMLTINQPYDGEFVYGLYDIDAIATDVFLATVEYNVDGTGWQNIVIGAEWDTSLISDGTHVLELRAMDLAGHTTSETLEVIVDNHAPTGEIVSPVDGEFIEGMYTVKVVANDAVGISAVTLTIVPSTIAAVPFSYNPATGYYEYTLATITLDDGSYNATVWLEDYAGYSYGPIVVSFQIDNHAPMLELLYPTDGMIVDGIDTI
jgi:hypothetical protein